MSKLSVDIETWPAETLVAAVLATGLSLEGPRADTAAAVAARLLCDLGGFAGLARATIEEIEEHLSTPSQILTKPPRAYARRIAAAFELGRRAARDTAEPEWIASSADVDAWASARLRHLDHEELWLLALDGRSRLRGVRCVARGGLHGMAVRAVDPIRLALRAAATGFVLVHNHPSGDPTPSKEDVEFTRRVADAAAVVGTPLLDHVVVARGGFSSVPFVAASGTVDA